jgi:hypothetical protein
VLTDKDLGDAVSESLDRDQEFRKLHDPDGSRLVHYNFVVRGGELTCEVYDWNEWCAWKAHRVMKKFRYILD